MTNSEADHTTSHHTYHTTSYTPHHIIHTTPHLTHHTTSYISRRTMPFKLSPIGYKHNVSDVSTEDKQTSLFAKPCYGEDVRL